MCSSVEAPEKLKENNLKKLRENIERESQLHLMDREENSQEGKTGNLERWGGLKGVEKIMVLDGGMVLVGMIMGRYEMALNSCLEALEGIMRLKRMWKVVPHAGKKEERKSGEGG